MDEENFTEEENSVEDDFEEERRGRWWGNQFCPHPGEPCIDGCYFCGRPISLGPHNHTQVSKGKDGEIYYSCVCDYC